MRAYGYAVGTETTTIVQNTDVIFDQGGTAAPSAGIGIPLPGGIAFTVFSSGDYEYSFYVVGGNDNAATTSLEFALFVNGVSQGAVHEFRSNQQNGAGDVQLLRGQGIIFLAAGDSVTLRNRTGAKVNVSAIAPGGEAGANRTLSLIKLSA